MTNFYDGYDHKPGEPVDVPVGTEILIPAFVLHELNTPVVLTDDGWMNQLTDEPLRWHIEDLPFDVFRVPTDPKDVF